MSRVTALGLTVVGFALTGCNDSTPAKDSTIVATLDRTKLGAPCSSDDCPQYWSCVDFTEVIAAEEGTMPNDAQLFCVEGGPCAAVTCGDGSCMADLTGPPVVRCVE